MLPLSSGQRCRYSLHSVAVFCPPRIRERKVGLSPAGASRMAHALLARGLRALLRAHQAANPWAAAAGTSGRGSVPCPSCGSQALLSPGVTASTGGQLPAPQSVSRLHTGAATVRALGAAAACGASTVSHASQQQSHGGQQSRTIRTTSGAVVVGPNSRAAVVAAAMVLVSRAFVQGCTGSALPHCC